MTAIDTALTHQGVTYAAEIVTIERTELGREDHGIFHLGLHVIFGGSGTMLGGYALDDKPDGDDPRKRQPTAYGMAWIMQVIETVLGEYGKWEDLPHKRIFALYEQDVDNYSRAGFSCKGIASLDGERVMIFSEVTDGRDS